VVGAMGGRNVYIADGHHRYETAIALRDQLAESVGRSLRERLPLAEREDHTTLSPEHPGNYVLMMCVSMSDPGMLVLATHRLFRGLPAMTSTELRDRLGNAFTIESSGGSPAHARLLWEEIALEGDQATLGLYTAKDDQWSVARLTDAGRRRMAEVATDHSADWQGLGVSILHRLVIDTLLDAANLPAPKYVRDIDEVVLGLTQGDSAGRDATGQQGTGGQFELAALVMPATVEHIRAISSHGERMPAKSTYFYPKLLSGLVINPLE
jgi:hypothetical protein